MNGRTRIEPHRNPSGIRVWLVRLDGREIGRFASEERAKRYIDRELPNVLAGLR